MSLKDIITKDILDSNRKRNENTRSVAIYLNTLPADSAAGKQKIKIMQAFAKPIASDPAFELTMVNPIPTQAAKIAKRMGERFKVYDTEFSFSFGYHFSPNPAALRSMLRKDLTAKHEQDRKIWYTDANPFNCYEKKIGYGKTNKERVRIVYGNIYPDKAEYFNKNSPSDRWEKISKEYGVELKPWQPIKPITPYFDRGFIYVCGNRGSSGYSAFGKNAADWMIQKALKIMKVTKRSIILRQHPANRIPTYERDKRVLDEFAAQSNGRVKIQSPTAWYPDHIENIRDCHCVVVFTSTAAAPAIIEGKPIFVEHPSSYMYSMSSGSKNNAGPHAGIKNIEDPYLGVDRQQWLNDYAYAHWSIKELERGEYWKRIRSQILSFS